MADDVSDGSSDSEEAEKAKDNSTTVKDAAQIISEQLAAFENPQSRDNPLNQSVASSSSKQGLIESQKTPMGSIGNSDNKNILPEDNEIIDEEEEEEEDV